jgi:curli production assembly/transport component CsgF
MLRKMGTMGMRQVRVLIACVVMAIGASAPVMATEQIYHPISPTFGGNPNNGTFLLSTAQAQGAGVNSGNQGPSLTGLDDALAKLGTSGTGGGSSGSNGSPGGATGPTNSGFRGASFRSQLNANPTGSAAAMP